MLQRQLSGRHGPCGARPRLAYASPPLSPLHATQPARRRGTILCLAFDWSALRGPCSPARASAARRVLQDKPSTLAPAPAGSGPPCCVCCDFQQGLGRRASAAALATLRLLLPSGPTTPALFGACLGLRVALRLRSCASCLARRRPKANSAAALLLSWPAVARTLPPLRPQLALAGPLATSAAATTAAFARDASFALAPQPCRACLGRPWPSRRCRQARYASIPASQRC